MQRTRREWEENLQTFREIDWDVIREERKG
jgi:ribosomal protein L28